MGMHQDRDEQDFDAPVVSVSLGDSAVFRIGGATRGGPTQGVTLQSGDVLTFGGPARLAFHGVTKVLPGSSTLLPQGGRINLTLRRVTRPPELYLRATTRAESRAPLPFGKAGRG